METTSKRIHGGMLTDEGHQETCDTDMEVDAAARLSHSAAGFQYIYQGTRFAIWVFRSPSYAVKRKPPYLELPPPALAGDEAHKEDTWTDEGNREKRTRPGEHVFRDRACRDTRRADCPRRRMFQKTNAKRQAARLSVGHTRAPFAAERGAHARAPFARARARPARLSVAHTRRREGRRHGSVAAWPKTHNSRRPEGQEILPWAPLAQWLERWSYEP